ncbi:MAG: fibrinogen-related protein [Nanoarchaeota archaeon]
MKKGCSNRHAQAGIISVILLILITLVAIVIVANIVIPLVREGGEDVTIDRFTTSFVIKDVKQSRNSSVSVQVLHERGSAMPDALTFLFYDSNGVNILIKRTTNIPQELETKTFNFLAPELNSPNKIVRVGVIPSFGNSVGSETQFEEKNFNYYSSCSDILLDGKSEGNLIYFIDLDEKGSIAPIKVYCDMTTDGGGWTLLWSNIHGLTPKSALSLSWNNALFSPSLTGGSVGTDLTAFNYFIGISYWERLGNELRYDWSNTLASPIDQRAYMDFYFDEVNPTSGNDEYRIRLSNYQQKIGSTSAGLYTYHNNAPLSTIDKDNDESTTSNCAANYASPSWHRACWSGSVNGFGVHPFGVNYNGAYWAGSDAQLGTDAGLGSGNGWMYARKK